MAHFKTQLGHARTFAAECAILIYQESAHGAGSDGGFATIHDIEGGEGGTPARLTPGRPMTTGDLRDALARLDATSAAQQGITLLPANLLAYAPGTLCWWRPPAPATLWFNLRDNKGKPDRQHPLMKLSGSKFPMPGLLFLCLDRSLRLFAVKGGGRPDGNTKLHVAPFWNTSEAGGLCLGTMPMPATPAPGNIAEIETAFFQSNFTHSNGRTHKGAHADLWRTARKAGEFPTALLRPALGTLSGILNRK